MKAMIWIFVVVAMLCGAVMAVLLWAAGGLTRPGQKPQAIFDFGQQAAPTQAPTNDVITVLTWNIAYARGTNPDNGVNEVASAEVIRDRLNRMGQLIAEHRVDLVLIQEIDFGAKRSQFVDELPKLAQSSGLRYGAQAVSWDANYVPYPYWPPRNHYGRLVSGGAVLSRFPITHNLVTLHEKPKQNWFYNLFYLSRYSQQVAVEINGKQRWVINNHLEAFNKENRMAQANRLAELVHQRVHDVLLFGGDLNTTPPEATKKHGFVDEPTDDYRDDNTLSQLRAIQPFAELVTESDYKANESSYFTFPSTAPTRRLDYLFTNTKLVSVAETKFVPIDDFSDHRPVLVRLKLK